MAIQKFNTTGCIAQTRATDESPWANIRSISQIGRADWRRLCQMPPYSIWTPVSKSPASRVRGDRLAALLAFPALRRERGGQCADVLINLSGIHREIP